MTRRTTQQVIEDSIKEGYELLENGVGSYDAAVDKYRMEGYDVRAWYVSRGTTRSWNLLGKVKQPRHSKQKKVDYSSLNVKQLKELCKSKKVAGYYKMSKSEMIEMLQVS